MNRSRLPRHLRRAAAISVLALMCAMVTACAPDTTDADGAKLKPAANAAAVPGGSAMVAGTGKDSYYIYDAAGKTLLISGRTNAAVALPPGNYLVNLNATGTKLPLTVRAGHTTTVTAGSAVVAGIGEDHFLIYDASTKTLVTTGLTNAATALFPGDYSIELNHTTQTLTVREGEETTVTAGTAMVADAGKSRYVVFNASGNVLASAYANVAVELFPGNYTVEYNGTKQPLEVRAGEHAVIGTK